MKRGAPLKRGKPPRRKTWMRSRKGNTSYSRRDRDFDFMGWVKRQPCVVRALRPSDFAITARSGLFQPSDIAIAIRETPCTGHVEADHAGSRGLGQKADDRTCIPLCANHHRERTDQFGMFRHLTRDELRCWRGAAISLTQAAWAAWSSNQ